MYHHAIILVINKIVWIKLLKSLTYKKRSEDKDENTCIEIGLVVVRITRQDAVISRYWYHISWMKELHSQDWTC